MDLKEKIQADLKEFLKSGKTFETGVLRMVSASILNKEIEKRAKLSKSQPIDEKLEEASKLTEEEVLDVMSFEAKKRSDSIREFEKGARQDLADKEKRELGIVKRYLPEQISEDEIRKIAEEAVKKSGAQSQKDMGKVMAEMMPKVKGKADGVLVSRIVKELLENRT